MKSTHETFLNNVPYIVFVDVVVKLLNSEKYLSILSSYFSSSLDSKQNKIEIEVSLQSRRRLNIEQGILAITIIFF